MIKAKLICDSLTLYAQIYTCSPSYTEEEQKKKIDFKAVCIRPGAHPETVKGGFNFSKSNQYPIALNLF